MHGAIARGSRTADNPTGMSDVRTLRRDGVSLAHLDAGSGEPPLLFVHGWACDHTFFGPHVEHFGRAHRVVAVDLRGHGASDRPRQAYTMAGFADDLAWLCRELGLARPVVIGHSMGGTVALELAARHPEVPAALVLLDAPVLPIPRVLENVAPVLAGLRGPDYRAVAEAYVRAYLTLPTDRRTHALRIPERLAGGSQWVMASALAEMFAHDGAAALAACRAPVLYVAANRVYVELDRLRRLSTGLVTGQTVGAGHFHQLEVPEQLTPMIERFLELVCGQRAKSGQA